MVFNGRLETAVEHEVSFPADRHPRRQQDPRAAVSRPAEPGDRRHGQPCCACPSAASSRPRPATYPNVLALDYMKRTKKLTPEVHAKAEGFIANGYQRLLTFEVPGGGFSWFGNAPANKILTAYGLMEFSDMSKVHDVDPKLIPRTQQWLAAPAAGRWKLEAGHAVHQRRRHQPLQLRRAAHHGLPRLVAGEHRLPGAGGGEGQAVRRTSHMSGEDGRLHAGRGGEFRRGLRQGSRLHPPGHAAVARRAHRKGRQGLVDGRRDRRLCHRRKRRRRDHRPGRAGAAQVGRGIGHRRARRCTTSPPRRTRPAHGAPRRPPSWRCARCCSPPRKARPTCAARWRSRSTARPWRNSR